MCIRDRPSAAAAKPDALADLERLAVLRGKGLLSEEEFEHGKKNLLARWLS